MPPAVSQPRAVVFDLDGLMFNTEEIYQFVGDAVLQRRGCRLETELLKMIMGRPGAIALQMMIDYHRLDVTVERLRSESEVLFADVLADRLQTMPGLLELLDGLDAADIPKAIATSSGRRFAETVLGHFDLQPRFSFLLTAEDIVEGKPHPEIYLLAARRLAVDPTEMLVLEDSENGCRAAVASGAVTIAVPGRWSCSHDFDGADLIAESLADKRVYRLLQLETGR